MAKITFNDGKEVVLSEETTKKLRDELLKPKYPIATVCYYYDMKRLILNLPDQYLAYDYKDKVLILDEKGYCPGTFSKTAKLPSSYTRCEKVF